MTVDGRTRSEWMSDEEHRLRQALEPVSLVVETNFSADEIRQVQQHYGQAATQMLRRGYRYQDVIKKYPALTLIALVGHAALAYDQGKYWDEFWDELGRGRDQDFENALRRSLAALLDKFQLARFPDLEARHQYVMTFAMHAGIPVHCLGDLLRVVDDHLVRGRDATGAALMEWLDEPGKQYRTLSLDVPVRNFIHYGGEFAVDILDRIIDVVDSVVTDPGLLESDLDSSTTGLPDILLDELLHQLREKPVGWQGRRATRAAVQRRPTLRYSVDDDQLLVCVPYPRMGAESPWRVSFDGQVQQVYTRRGWGVSSEDQASPTTVPVAEPVREILLWHSASDLSFALPTVDKSDPLMTFTADGVWIAKREMLKRGSIWVVYPEHSELVDPDTGEAVSSMVTGAPAGWRGWSSALIDVSDIDAIQLRRNGDLIGHRRPVRRDTTPTFDLGEPVTGCQSLDGRPVYSTRPMVLLPMSREPAAWRIRTRRLDSEEWLVNDEWDSDEVTTYVDPFDETPEPQLGTFEIVVTGPLGADGRLVLFLAEGLTVAFDNPPRIPTAHGLSPIAATIDCGEGLSVSTDRLVFGATGCDQAIEITNGSETAGLLVRPPYVEIRTGQVGKPASWRTAADVCAPQELSEDRFVAIRAHGVVATQFAFINPAGEQTHTEVRPRRKAGDVYEESTRRFVDAARSATTGRIVAQLVTVDGRTIDVTVLAVRPPRLCSGADISTGGLVFHGLLTVDDLAAQIWCSTAPWVPPRAISLSEDRAELPKDLVGAGPLLCEVFVEDPWVAVEPPRWPGPNAIRVNQPGWFSGGGDASTKLSRFLAGEGSPPESVSTMPEVWSALCFPMPDHDSVGNQRTASALTRLLRSEPRAALEALGNSTVPIEEKMALLVRTELVNCSFATSFTLNELHADPWFGLMVEMADLPALYQKRREVRAERSETLAYLKDKGGDQLTETLRFGKADYVQEGSFARNVAVMDGWPPSQVDALLDELRLVPGALLDPDTRMAASVEAFRRRSDWMAQGWSEGFAAQTSFAMAPIRRACPLAYDAIALRNTMLDGVDTRRHPWMLMTLQSLTLAVLARLEAHGRIAGQYLNSGMLSAWARLAELCPRLVATDLLIAEALVIHYCSGDVIGDQP
ncbi:hypothetical protein [Mycobacterium talmoniae]|uniref:Uncharacterized protein n=1 Tax=Mycobacterium talmoniae TaxID=1858794 RepID=A0A1S1NCP6_9MYCO|nr:hypothetical protein [Mycobacterium talmoniae]OHU97395.1 hypothetical protein BKN37_21975 [Mycobacterium talmoniae]